ncbi:MAG TPA: hypothetical protein VEN81_03105 [Planctomycetota bacterium]|nr:hypothetical protein [Planctomycetota bacterium]
MLRKMLGPLGRVHWEKIASRIGAFASNHQSKGAGALTAAAFVLVVLLVHREIYSFITGRRQFTVPQKDVAVAPAWLQRGSQGVELVRLGKPGVSLYDPGLVERIGRTFEECPWVRRVTAVERVFPDQVRVRFDYRTPEVAVKRPGGYVIVDAEGVRLPGVYVDPPASCARSIEITGVTSLPPAPGCPWNDPALRSAMELAAFAQENPLLARLRVREVDMSNFGGKADPRKSEVAFVTATGCAIAWGRAPGDGKFGEPSTEEKLENLRSVLAAYPGLYGVRTVKVYFRGSRAIEPSDLVQKPR